MFLSDRQWSGPHHLMTLGSVWMESVCRELQPAAKTPEIQCVSQVDKTRKCDESSTSLLLKKSES